MVDAAAWLDMASYREGARRDRLQTISDVFSFLRRFRRRLSAAGRGATESREMGGLALDPPRFRSVPPKRLRLGHRTGCSIETPCSGFRKSGSLSARPVNAETASQRKVLRRKLIARKTCRFVNSLKRTCEAYRDTQTAFGQELSIESHKLHSMQPWTWSRGDPVPQSDQRSPPSSRFRAIGPTRDLGPPSRYE